MISAILYGRNDSHGYNLHKRAAISFNCIAEVLTHENDEIIFVDCNTPNDMPTFIEAIHDTLTEKAKRLLKIFRIRPEMYEKNKKGSHLYVLEPLARNVGIRRSNPKNRWILSTNTDMVFISRYKDKSLSDIVSDLPDGFYELPRFEVPEAIWESVDRKNSEDVINKFEYWGKKLHLNDAVISRPDIRYDGPGDFQLMLREQFFAISGFDEDMVLGWHVDSNICKRFFLLNGKTDTLIDKVFAYHCDHTRQATLAHNYNRKENDQKIFVENIKTPYLHAQADSWGLPDENIEQIFIKDINKKTFINSLESMLPGLTVPYTEDIFDAGTNNHGLLYDNNHIFPYLTDHFTTFPSEWNYGYFGCNLDLLSKIGEFRLKMGHTGKVLFLGELFDFAGIKQFPILPANCISSHIDTINDKSEISIIDAGLNHFETVKNKLGVIFPKGNKALLRYLVKFYNNFIKAAHYEDKQIKNKNKLPRKFVIIGSQTTWFEIISMQLIGVVLAPFSGHVRTGYLREDAFECPLFPPALDTFYDSNEIIHDISKVLKRKVTFEEYYAAGIRLQNWLGMHKDEEAFSKKLMELPVTEIDFALLKCRAEICRLVRQNDLSNLMNSILDLLARIHPGTAERIKNYKPDLVGIEFEDLIENNEPANIDDNKLYGKEKLNVFLHAPLYDPSGYADESRNILFGLDKLGTNISAVPINWSSTKANLPQNEIDRLNKLIVLPGSKPDKAISLFNIFPKFYKRAAYADYHIGRTMFETDRIPQEWIAACNMMDEIWVPSEFNINTFASSGVEKSKLVKIPESIDVNLFDLNAKPLDIPGKKKFNFLSVFDWSLRKGWDILLRAFIEEFGNKEDAGLVIKTWSSYGKSLDQIKAEAKSFIIKSGLAASIPDNIIFIEKNLSAKELSGLYKSADAFVLPTHGEGWGRPFMEAMLMSLPVIGTKWSGQLEFMNDSNSFLIDCSVEDVNETAWKKIPAFKGHKWANPSLKHLRELMRLVFENKDITKSKTAKAHTDIINNFSRDIVTDIIFGRLKEINKKLSDNKGISTSPKPAEKQTVKEDNSKSIKNIVWEGPQFSCSSLALINREHCKRLATDGFNLSITSNETDSTRLQLKDFKFLKELMNKNLNQVDLHISHQFPPNLNEPEQGYKVIIQPWEFGSLPKEWVEIFSSKADELWVPSNYVKQVYTESGIPADKVFVIPNGFDPGKYNQNAKPYKLKTKKKFKFLFVGGTIYRKGIDILLDTYIHAFKKSDDVCLVIKDMGGDSFYKGQSYRERILEIIKTPGTPEIEYIDKTLTEKQLAGLYTACDVLVHPYRGEGFGLPVLEAMACGLPVIVTEGGSCNDFCTPENSLFIKAEKVYYKDKKVGDLETVSNPWLYEPSRDDLQNKMVYAFGNGSCLKELGSKAHNYVHENFTWDKAYGKLKERINMINNPANSSFESEKEDLFISSFNSFLKLTDIKDYQSASKLIEVVLGHFDTSSRKGFENIEYKDLLNLAGSIFLTINNLEKAQEYFEQELNNDPASARACIGLGEVFFTAGMFTESKTMFEWAVTNDPQSDTAVLGLAKANGKLGLQDNHNNLSPEDPAEEIAKAEELIQNDDYKAANAILEKVLEKHPDNTDALNNSSVAQILMGNYKKALDLIEKVLELDASNKIAMNNLNYLMTVSGITAPKN